MPAARLILALLLAAAPASAQDDLVAATAARTKTFPAAHAVERADAYTPAETVRGELRALPIARRSPGASAALVPAQTYADATGSFALLVLRNGVIIHERYAAGFDATSRFSPASMHKTVLALAIGVAVQRSLIALDAPVERWLTEWRGDPRGRITVRQLLEMASGLETPPFGPDPAGKSAQLTFAPDIAKVALSYRKAAEPGSVFAYGNVNSQLLAMVLERATGERYAAWLSRTIWQPIGASDASVWLDRPGGLAHGFCCLQATARDWARVGQLILDKGRAGGRRVVPAKWIAAMASPSRANPNYGYQLWRAAPYAPERRYSASSMLVAKAAKPYLRDDILFMDGAIGQRVYIVPSERLVIVRIGKSNPGWDDSELPNLVIAGLR